MRFSDANCCQAIHVHGPTVSAFVAAAPPLGFLEPVDAPDFTGDPALTGELAALSDALTPWLLKLCSVWR